MITVSFFVIYCLPWASIQEPHRVTFKTKTRKFSHAWKQILPWGAHSQDEEPDGATKTKKQSWRRRWGWLNDQLGGFGTILTVPGYPLKDKSFSPGFYQNGLFQPNLTLKKMPLLVLSSCRTIVQRKKKEIKLGHRHILQQFLFPSCLFCL